MVLALINSEAIDFSCFLGKVGLNYGKYCRGIEK